MTHLSGFVTNSHKNVFHISFPHLLSEICTVAGVCVCWGWGGLGGLDAWMLNLCFTKHYLTEFRITSPIGNGFRLCLTMKYFRTKGILQKQLCNRSAETICLPL